MHSIIYIRLIFIIQPFFTLLFACAFDIIQSIRISHIVLTIDPYQNDEQNVSIQWMEKKMKNRSGLGFYNNAIFCCYSLSSF